MVIKFFLELVNSLVPPQFLPETLFNINTDFLGSGVVWVVLVILLTGVLVTNIIGRKVVELWERFLNKIPGFRGIYSALKKLSSTMLSPSSENFKKALLVQYPREGMWTIAFQSGSYRGEVETIIGEEIINLYVPTTPNPTSGFFIMMPKKDTIELKMSVEEAFKLIISTGVVTPDLLDIKDKK